jgi:hypothetical protein
MRQEEAAILKGHDFKRAEDDRKDCFVSGHDFSRAADGRKSTGL